MAIGLVLCVGCSEPLYWAKPNAQEGEFEQDSTDCRRVVESQQNEANPLGLPTISASVGTDSVPLERCLADKGWFLTRKPKD